MDANKPAERGLRTCWTAPFEGQRRDRNTQHPLHCRRLSLQGGRPLRAQLLSLGPRCRTAGQDLTGWQVLRFSFESAKLKSIGPALWEERGAQESHEMGEGVDAEPVVVYGKLIIAR